ncbi:MAG: hypothetical protein QOF98_1285, partial [Streptomyces sp.]|nr:hypothetical protein [Streptomyces sp.]
ESNARGGQHILGPDKQDFLVVHQELPQ